MIDFDQLRLDELRARIAKPIGADDVEAMKREHDDILIAKARATDSSHDRWHAEKSASDGGRIKRKLTPPSR